MIIIDAFIRFSGIGLMLLLMAILLRDYRKWRSMPYLVLTCISVSAAFLGYAPAELRIGGIPFIIARLLDIPMLVFIWLFALSLFDAHFRLKSHHVIIGLAFSTPMLVTRLYDLGMAFVLPIWLDPLISFLSICLMLHLCIVTLGGRRDDLSNKRRASRIYFVLILLFVTVVAAVSEPLMPLISFPNETFKIMSIWPAIIWGVYWMTSFNKNAVTFSAATPAETAMSEKDKILQEKLNDLVMKNEIFRDPNLTIVSLARQLGVNQHRLRSLINQCLGYPNFSSYINSQRIASVKQSLVDPKKAHIPILTLAMDAGFKSLSPFNVAFKRLEDMTPTEYRQAHRL